jgi:hypothetical protein
MAAIPEALKTTSFTAFVNAHRLKQLRSNLRGAWASKASDKLEARFGRQVKLLDHPILGPLTAPQWRKHTAR